MKTRKFGAIYILLVALGLGIFYAFAGSIEEVPLGLSEAEMQNLFGGDASNHKCVTRTGCYPNSSGCNGSGDYYSGSLSWESCTDYAGKFCNIDEGSGRIVCSVTHYTNSNCTGSTTGTDQWNRPQYCTTSNM